jgi:hypothetical protein
LNAAARQLAGDLVVAEGAHSGRLVRAGLSWAGWAEVDRGVIARRQGGISMNRGRHGTFHQHGRRVSRRDGLRLGDHGGDRGLGNGGDLGSCHCAVGSAQVALQRLQLDLQGRAALVGRIGEIVVDHRPLSRAPVGLEPAADRVDPPGEIGGQVIETRNRRFDHRMSHR